MSADATKEWNIYIFFLNRICLAQLAPTRGIPRGLKLYCTVCRSSVKPTRRLIPLPTFLPHFPNVEGQGGSAAPLDCSHLGGSVADTGDQLIVLQSVSLFQNASAPGRYYYSLMLTVSSVQFLWNTCRYGGRTTYGLLRNEAYILAQSSRQRVSVPPLPEKYLENI